MEEFKNPYEPTEPTVPKKDESGKREGALIGWVIAQGEEEGNVGSSNDPFLVGSAGTVPAGPGGQLFLSINDDLSSAYGSGFADNLGFIVVNVSMQEVI